MHLLHMVQHLAFHELVHGCMVIIWQLFPFKNMSYDRTISLQHRPVGLLQITDLWLIISDSSHLDDNVLCHCFCMLHHLGVITFGPGSLTVPCSLENFVHCLLFQMNGSYATQCISHLVVGSLEIFQTHVETGQGCNPSVPCGIKVGCH